MTSLHLRNRSGKSIQQQLQHSAHSGSDRRQHRRHDLEQQSIKMERWEGSDSNKADFGQILDLSAGGARVRTKQTGIKPDHQIRVRMELPANYGICPFVDTTGGRPQPKREWIGWMTVTRVDVISERECEVAGPLVDMEEVDRGMLGLYLSTHPLAA